MKVTIIGASGETRVLRGRSVIESELQSLTRQVTELRDNADKRWKQDRRLSDDLLKLRKLVPELRQFTEVTTVSMWGGEVKETSAHIDHKKIRAIRKSEKRAKQDALRASVAKADAPKCANVLIETKSEDAKA